jgi:hypothetical protein
MMIMIWWVVMSCDLEKARRFGGTSPPPSFPRVNNKKLKEAGDKPRSVLGLLFDLEYGGDVLLEIFGLSPKFTSFLPQRTALYATTRWEPNPH